VKRPELTTLANFLDPSDGRTKNLCRNATTSSVTFGSNVNPATGTTENLYQYCPTGTTSNLAPFEERFLGDTWKPRVSLGAGVNWNSPFGPFRIDFAYALRKEEGDDTKRFSFNVGTQF
jgi:outer membrane protein insertion porin family